MNELTPVLVAGIVLVVGGLLWLLHTITPPPPPPPDEPVDPPPDEPVDPPPPDEPGNPDVANVPTFHVVALGLDGAGKTVLLASQSHEMSPSGERCYHFAGDIDQNLFLADLYQQLSDTAKPWPEATLPANGRVFSFACREARTRRIVFWMMYQDHSGEILRPRPDGTLAEAKKLESDVETADVLFVILDGRRVLQRLRDKPEGHRYFDSELWPLLALANRASCHVQLIVAKWDEVRTYDESLDDDELLAKVRRRLMQYGTIEQLVDAHCRRQEEVRLIPVSSIGSQFAEVPDDEQPPRKRKGGTLQPINVDVPLCAVVPDLLRQAERSLQPAMRARLDDEIQRAPDNDVSTIVHSVMGSQLGLPLRGLLATVFGDWLVATLVAWLARMQADRPAAVEDQAEAQRLHADHDDEADMQRLQTDVIVDMTRRVERFEKDVPSSLLCTRRPR